MARLLEVDRLKSEFVATVSHELRTPLTSILGSASTLRRMGDQMSPEERNNFLAMIDRQGRRLLRLIEDILFASRIEAGEHGLHPEPCDVVELAQEAVDNLRSRPGGERIRLRTDLSHQVVFADPMAVHQILDNLLENALKYAPGKEPIEVIVDAGPDEATLVVSDRGPGIPPDEVPHIFERFRQVDGSVTRRAPGVGLGLYIVRKLVEELDGRIWCESTPGEGSRFILTLPTRSYEEAFS